MSRGISTALAVAVTGVVGLALSPGAWADVTISPPNATQGDAVRLTFYVPDTQTAYTTKVKVELPANAPIGEADPLSVPGWAPQVDYRNLATPVPGIHGGSTSVITSSVTWTRVAKAPTSRGVVNQLILSMGPLPYVARLPFNVVQTFSDGTVHTWKAPTPDELTSRTAGPQLILTPAPGATGPDGSAGISGMQGMAGMGGQVAQSQTVAPGSTPAASSGGPFGSFGAGLLGGLLIAALVGAWVMILRARRGPSGETAASAPTVPDAPPATAEAAVQPEPESVSSGK